MERNYNILRDYLESKDVFILGLGSGTTVRYFTEGLGRLVAGGMKVRGVPTSRATAEIAASNGITVIEELVGQIDLTVDGADEVDPNLSLIKGRGGALFREKLVAAASKRFVVVVDESKVVERLGAGVLPVEVLPFLWRTTAERLAGLCSGLKVRGGEEQPYLTDNGNLILDLSFEDGIADATALGSSLKAVTGVVEQIIDANRANRAKGPAGNHGSRLRAELARTGQRLPLLGDDDVAADRNYIREFILDRRRALGQRHGVQYAEAFHHIGGGARSKAVEEYIRKNAVPLR